MSAYSAAFPNGVSSGDVTQSSAVLWTRAVEIGALTLQVATDAAFSNIIRTDNLTVTDPMVPAKIVVDGLDPAQEYFYRFTDASVDFIDGQFETANELGEEHGFHFGIVADLHGRLVPYPAIKNALEADLDLVIKLGDTVTADLPTETPGIFVLNDGTLATYQSIHSAAYSAHFGANFIAELQATTPILAIPDDHELLDDYSGGAAPSSDARFPNEPGADFINETSFYTNAHTAFVQYNAIEEKTYSGTGDDLFDGAPDLYRYNTYGSDAAIIVADGRSFRDAEVAFLQDVPLPFPSISFLQGAFEPGRSLLGETQLERLKNDLLDARDNGVVWKFVVLPEAIQNFGPVLRPGDRYEGYAAERNELLKFIDQNHIENVVFITADTHWTMVNNLTYQDSFGGPQIATSAIDINTLSVGDPGFASLVPPVAASLGVIPPAAVGIYNSLPVAPDGDDAPNDKDDFVKQILNGVITALGYDPIGLDDNLPAASGKINAELLQGDYFVGHNLGWTDFDIDPVTDKMRVTTYGITPYTAEELAADPATILAREPAIVSQFELTATTDSIIGTPDDDDLHGGPGDDVVLGADGNDVLSGRSGDDYLDGGNDNDSLQGGGGGDELFGRDGNDTLDGQSGDDRLTGGTGDDSILAGGGTDELFGEDGNDEMDGQAGNDRLTGGAGDDSAVGGGGNDTFVATEGDGNDTYTGGGAIDTLDLSGTDAAATVSLLDQTATSADIGSDIVSTIENVVGTGGNDTLTGDNHGNQLEGRDGNDNLDGGKGADTLEGGVGDDILDGGKSSDVLNGGEGNDTMTGGADGDIFEFASGFGNDRIEDFDADPAGGQDFLDITDFGITPTDFATRVTITEVGDDTLVTIDGDAGQTILLVGVPAALVTQEDFPLLL